MNDSQPNPFQRRIEDAAEAVLTREGSVGPLGLFQELGWLHPEHVKGWRNGVADYRILMPWIRVGPDKFEKTIRHFKAWASARGLQSITTPHTRRGAAGIEPLQVTADGDPEWEKFFSTQFAPADLPAAKTARLTAKLNRPPELVVFEKVSEEGQCHECGVELGKGEYLTMEKGQPLCLACADLDHLVFLPAGDTAMSRRARKHSPLSAVVVRFNRTRKRYERQGLLVTEAALKQAEDACAADAPERAEARARAAVARQEDDHEFVSTWTLAIGRQYPGCPPAEARQIAEHTGRRNSGRVGRSAAGRALAAAAVDLAVIAHIRHAHTDYDALLMRGTERLEARQQVRGKIDQMLATWAAAQPQPATNP